MGKITTKKSNSGDEIKEKKNEIQSCSSYSSSSESSFSSSSDTSDEEFDTRKRKKSGKKKKSKKQKKKNQCILITETISTIEAKIGICPQCNSIDDESEQMIGCDRCNNWFHYKCAEILVEPKDEKWFCKKCVEFNNKKR